MTRILMMIVLAGPLSGQIPEGIKNRPAPKWDVKQWINLGEGREALEVDDLRGKVVYLYTFQSW